MSRLIEKLTSGGYTVWEDKGGFALVHGPGPGTRHSYYSSRAAMKRALPTLETDPDMVLIWEGQLTAGSIEKLSDRGWRFFRLTLDTIKAMTWSHKNGRRTRGWAHHAAYTVPNLQEIVGDPKALTI